MIIRTGFVSGWLRAGAVTAAMTVAACGGKGGDAAGGAAASGEDWSAVALSAKDVVIDGQELVVQLPSGMRVDPSFAGKYVADTKNNFSLPSFDFSVGKSKPNPELQLKMASTKAKPLTVVKQGDIPGGQVVSAHTADNGTLWLLAYKQLPDGRVLQCEASQAKSGGVPNPEATLALFEKVCTSMEPKGGQAAPAAKPEPAPAAAKPEPAPAATPEPAPAAAKPAVKLDALQLGDKGFDGKYDKALEQWSFEKYVPDGEGGNDLAVQLYVDGWDAAWPKDGPGFAGKLAAAGFLDEGTRWKGAKAEVFEGGWVVVGTANDGEDDQLAFAVRLEPSDVLCRGFVMSEVPAGKQAALRDEAIAACKSAKL